MRNAQKLQRLLAAIDPAELTSSLVQICSVNPGVLELELSTAIEGWLAVHTDAAVTRVETLKDRYSLAAVVKGSNPGPRLVLNGHMDTVPAFSPDSWRHEPFSGSIVDGRIHGRGACDMKAGLAVAMGLARKFSNLRDIIHGSLILHFAVGEELGEPGTVSLLNAGFGGDFAIVLEPTCLRVATAGLGLAFFEVNVGGRGGHAGRPELAANPILALPRILSAAENYSRRLGERHHRLLPPPTCTPTVVQAGESPNAIPDECHLIFDRRLIPGEGAEGELDSFADLVRTAAGPDLEVDVRLGGTSFEPVESPSDGLLAVTARDALGSGVASSPWGAPYASDFSRLASAECEAIIFGPGDIALAHAVDESVSVADIEQATSILSEVISRILVPYVD